MNKGLFIVFEGIDGSGTTSNSKLIAKWLADKGLPVIWTSEPTRSDIGLLIKQNLKKRTEDPHIDALLFAADRIWHVKKIIKPYLNKGYIVISDRFLESSIAYQGAQGVNIDWIKSINLINKLTISPDITFLLDVSPEKSLERIKDREIKERFEKIDFLRKVRKIYLTRATLNNYYIIDAEKEIDKIQEELKDIITEFLKKKRLFL